MKSACDARANCPILRGLLAMLPMVTDKQQVAGGSSRAGWFLLGAALLLAAGSIGYNIYQGSGGDAAPAPVDGAPPTIERLRAAAEASTKDADPWAELAFAYFQQGQFGAGVGARCGGEARRRAGRLRR